MFARRPLILKVWTPESNLERSGVDKVPVWIRIPSLSLQFWNEEMFSKIASYVGNPLYADGATSDIARIAYARLYVEVNAKNEQPDEVPLVNERKETFMQKMMYEFKPLKCVHCCIFGHSEDHYRYGGKKKSNKQHEIWVEKQGVESKVEEEKEYGPIKQIVVSNPFEELEEKEQEGGSSAKGKSGDGCVRTSARAKQVPQIMKRAASTGATKKAIIFGHKRSSKSQGDDFNIIRSVDEAKGGKALDKAIISEFNECLSTAGLMNFPSEECRFTWSRNSEEKSILKVLDRIVCNNEWL
ncbi:hypothetical protein LIER_04851 [Lithospermum erythrorhizon]|uniref:DUF4283 domain-containing protein n=1 Tax=Lithospermum erythrorhizon TaxID=34254 RepID=A0AAV3NZ67_LITER